MSNERWVDLLLDRFNRDHPDQGGSIEVMLGEPASMDDIIDACPFFKVMWPDEFVELYRCHNGVGERHASGEVYWFFLPLHMIPKLTSDARVWVGDGHPDLAGRFFPFYDWGDGDSVGYMVDDQAAIQSGLYQFDHNSFDFDKGQPESEFMIRAYDSIVDLIKT